MNKVRLQRRDRRQICLIFTMTKRVVTQLQSLHTAGWQAEGDENNSVGTVRRREQEQVGVSDMTTETGVRLVASSFNKHLAIDLWGSPSSSSLPGSMVLIYG